MIKSLKNNIPLSQYIDKYKAIIEENLLRLLGPSVISPFTLYQSMHYSLFAGGKRIRSILCIASAETVGGAIDDAIHVASSIEMIHTYSLIHDDLPSMDNDDLRRGKPTNHKVFGEATAILAGDALLTLAFTTLSDISMLRNVPPEKALNVINEIALASGHYGMVGGQQLDMESQGKRIDISSLEEMHRKKTGALIRASVRAGGIIGGATNLQLLALTEYGENIGHAFQIADDILDVEGSIKDVGKTLRKDLVQNKNTYPAMIGLVESKALEKRLIDKAIEALDKLDERADPLRMIAKYIVERKN